MLILPPFRFSSQFCYLKKKKKKKVEFYHFKPQRETFRCLTAHALLTLYYFENCVLKQCVWKWSTLTLSSTCMEVLFHVSAERHIFLARIYSKPTAAAGGRAQRH